MPSKTTKACDWIVFVDIDGNWQAEVNEHDPDKDQVQTIYDMGGTVYGMCYMEGRDSAINYIEDASRRVRRGI